MDKEKLLQQAKETVKIEIEELKKFHERLDENIVNAALLIYKNNARVVVSGIGKSGLIGRKISATLSSTGTPSLFLHPTEALHGDLGTLQKEDVLLLLSKSGHTEEVNNLLAFAKRLGNKVIAFCGNKDSFLAKNSDVFIDISVEREACPMGVAPTSSTTCTLVAGDALAAVLIKLRNFTKKDFAFLHPAGTLGRALTLYVKDLMHTDKELPFVRKEDDLKQVLLVMTSKKFGTAFIVDENRQLLGIITDGDIRRFLEKDSDLNKTAQQIMTKNPKVITPEILAEQALKFMEDNKITVLPVVENNKVVGLLHIHDLLTAKIR